MTPEVLEQYKDMIADTTSDLNMHLDEMQQRIDSLTTGDVEAIDDVAVEWDALLAEKQSTKQGLVMCASLSAQILQFEKASADSPRYSGRPSAYTHMKTGLSEASRSIQSLVTRLQTHEADITNQLEAMSLQDSLPEAVALQLDRLQETKKSLSQCIQIVSEAGELANERSNVFEDLTLADNSYALSVSTVNDLVTARRLNLSGRSRHLGGQVTDETVQKSIEALTRLDAEHLRSSTPMEGPQQASTSHTSKSSNNPMEASGFDDRFGTGFVLASNKAKE